MIRSVQGRFFLWIKSRGFLKSPAPPILGTGPINRALSFGQQLFGRFCPGRAYKDPGGRSPIPGCRFRAGGRRTVQGLRSGLRRRRRTTPRGRPGRCEPVGVAAAPTGSSPAKGKAERGGREELTGCGTCIHGKAARAKNGRVRCTMLRWGNKMARPSTSQDET
jgi:hypothetical protein